MDKSKALSEVHVHGSGLLGQDISFLSYPKEPPIFYISISNLFSDHTKMALHDGPNAKAPKIADCKFRKFGRDFNIHLLGSREGVAAEAGHAKETTTTIMVDKPGKKGKEYTWLMPLSGSSGVKVESKGASGIGAEKDDEKAIESSPLTSTSASQPPPYETTFNWQRMDTPFPGSTDWRDSSTEASFSNPNLKLSDTLSNEVHAVFFYERSGRSLVYHTRGQIQFRRSLGRHWEAMVLITLGSLLEQERQRRDRRGNFTAGMAY